MSLCNPKNCLICQSKDYRVIFSYYEPDQYEVAVGVSKEGYFRKWVQCKQCRFYYSIYSREKNILDKVYTSTYGNKNSSWRKDSSEERFKQVIALPEGESETKFRVNWIKKNVNDSWKYELLKQATPPYNVLEHLKDPISFIKDLHNDMTSNSFLYIEVPDAICFKYKQAQDDIFNSCHSWMFSPNTLTPLLDRCGFEIFCLNRVKTKRGHYALMVLAGKK